LRLDKWLWAARFFKTRSLAQQAIAAGRVKLNAERTKPAHELKVGDLVHVRVQDWEWTICIKMLSDRRGPAAVARTLYAEREESRVEREKKMALRRYSAEPAAELRGRPTKRDRRKLQDWTSPPDES
jgi:ribosome-associated heat shock protein Hsp15